MLHLLYRLWGMSVLTTGTNTLQVNLSVPFEIEYIVVGDHAAVAAHDTIGFYRQDLNTFVIGKTNTLNSGTYSVMWLALGV